MVIKFCLQGRDWTRTKWALSKSPVSSMPENLIAIRIQIVVYSLFYCADDTQSSNERSHTGCNTRGSLLSFCSWSCPTSVTETSSLSIRNCLRTIFSLVADKPANSIPRYIYILIVSQTNWCAATKRMQLNANMIASTPLFPAPLTPLPPPYSIERTTVAFNTHTQKESFFFFDTLGPDSSSTGCVPVSMQDRVAAQQLLCVPLLNCE